MSCMVRAARRAWWEILQDVGCSAVTPPRVAKQPQWGVREARSSLRAPNFAMLLCDFEATHADSAN